MTNVNDQLVTPADVINMAFGRELPENARKTVNDMAALALLYPAVWSVFKAFVDANLNGELKPVEVH